ncbi:MAG: CRISPR-associated endonuclease Cas1 [Alphaproteobacteria bacterium]|nr:CRISPR-associated endonuclease Cas1 [Alphaproteobacteria bacterium]
MLNEWVYCPRLFALEWLNNEWADNADTARGRRVHKRVDRPDDRSIPDAGEVRSVYLGDDALGLVAKIDLVEADGGAVVPVDYKKGKPAPNAHGAWDPERVQVCAQGLLLRAHGYRCDHGILYFAGAKRRVEVPMSEALIAQTLAARDQARAVVEANTLPPPLVDSPKCPRCSLVGICLPDEGNLLAGKGEAVRPLTPQRDDGLPLYAQMFGGRLAKDAEEIVISEQGEVKGRVRLAETSRVVVMGNVTVTTPLLRELAERDIPVAFHSYGGWLYGSFTPSHGRNVIARMAQHRAANDDVQSLAFARAFVRSKILNGRVLLRRNGEGVSTETLGRLKELAAQAAEAPSVPSLMGVEGVAARLYFQSFTRMLKGPLQEVFRMDGRSRRPPRDPVNALLSFAYACLTRELTHITAGIGLDPYVGYLHQPRCGRPALALDLMEEFRPVISDSVVINAINNQVVTEGDFIVRPTGVALTKKGRGAFLRVLERRMDEVATHPVLGTRLSYRRILEVQARLLAKVLTGELDAYPEYRVR